MSRSRTCVLALALALCATPSYAGYLAGGAGAYAGWFGTSSFDNGLAAPNDLKGTIDYAVYAPGSWPVGPTSNFTFTPAGLDTSQMLYTYQIFSDGSDPVSLELLAINGPGQDAGWFEDLVNSVTGEIPTSSAVIPNVFAAWTFDGLVAGESSMGLMFTSPNLPEFSSALIQDGGSSTFANDLPAPGPFSIPEPGTMTLALGGLVGLGLMLLRRRRARA